MQKVVENTPKTIERGGGPFRFPRILILEYWFNHYILQLKNAQFTLIACPTHFKSTLWELREMMDRKENCKVQIIVF